jgi:2'-5' RNA ligase
MRLFCGIEIPAGIKASLGALTDRLRPLAKLAWSPTENLHVTTKFIGEWPEARVDGITRALAEIPRPRMIKISVRGLGWFPNDRNPRVLWAGIQSGEGLGSLAGETERRLAILGVPAEERAFHPHLTLARRRDSVSIDGLRTEVAGIASTDFGTFHAESFFLYLSRAGRYTKLQEFSLES